MTKAGNTKPRKPTGAKKGAEGGAGATWTVRGVSPETREAAKVAAKRAGMTTGAWIDQALRKAAIETIQGGNPTPAPRTDETLSRLVDVVERIEADRAADRKELAALRDQVEQKRRRGFFARWLGRVDVKAENKPVDAP